LFPKGNALFTVLTLRSKRLRDHAGQVSLPGGALDDGEGVFECAAREAGEELAVPAGELVHLGQLTPLYIPPSDFCLSPVVAAITHRPCFDPQGSEVDEVIEVPVSRLISSGARRVETWDIGGERRLVPYYDVGRHKVWGATAMVLCELAAAVAEVN
jgi:8-oxo-dGTP pyrophosphatase MutT (NUDIX family)